MSAKNRHKGSGAGAADDAASPDSPRRRGEKSPTKSGYGWPWAAGAVLVLAAAVAAGFYWERTLTVKQVRFSGNWFVETQTLAEQVSVPTGVRPDSLDYPGLIARAERIPYVWHAEIEVEPSGNLLVQIRERQPLAMLAEGSPKRYVDAEGVVLPLVLGKTVDLPLLYGFTAAEAGDTLQGEAFAAASRFLQTLRERTVSDATISEVAWTPGEGIVALTHENGVKLLFGREDYGRRLQNWEAFYAEVVRREGIQNMREIDLRFRGQIVTR